ncbi:MAG TPA: hypothetical protein VFM36_10020 [Thermoanaerobaculia bacterium]|nr:hypothetical protein [Thermoanaerobaculia bacterium]
MRSIRSFSRAPINKRRGEGGFVLIAALTLAVLYFALMELMLVDSGRELAEAQRFRSRIVAGIVAENAVELAAHRMAVSGGMSINENDDQGSMRARMTRGGGDAFEIVGEARTSGVLPQEAKVFVQGRVDASGNISIDYTMHGQ